MRKRIKDIARGRFEYAKPILSFSEEQISFSVIEGREYSGSFEFHHVDRSGSTGGCDGGYTEKRVQFEIGLETGGYYVRYCDIWRDPDRLYLSG